MSKTTQPILTLERTYQIEAAHSLPATPEDHKCHRTHGHNWEITIAVKGPVDPHLGWVVDYSAIDTHWQSIHNTIDHQNLNTIQGLTNPTSENLCLWIAEKLNALASENYSLVRVVVKENSRSKAILELS